jgi:hypothetical protein
MKPKYPVYVVSKGRIKNNLTSRFFIEDEVDFKIVVEPQEADDYAKEFTRERLLILPFSNLGMGSMSARNWIWEHSIKNGANRHWIFDDNIYKIGRLHKGKRIRVNANIGMKVVEDFTDRYTNIGISGFNYQMFVPNDKKIPFSINCHVYSAMLIKNDMPHRWRLRYNEDTDLCLQVLTNKLCTVLFHTFNVEKVRTMVMKGGNTDELYKSDGRLKMARSLEAMWPKYVKVKWRFGRPQHIIKDNWQCFTTKLERRKDIDWSKFDKINNYGLKLTKRNKIKSKTLQKFYDQNKN